VVLCAGVYLFRDAGLTDAGVGSILLAVSLLTLCTSLVLTVKLLSSSLRGGVLAAVERTINAELPGRAGAALTGCLAMLVGAALTIVVQSSSVFTSVLTPLVGVGVLSVERMYPLTLGANIGTTMTGLLAALASPADRLPLALQVALCHLLFNLSGIVLFYPLPRLRLPVRLAHAMGSTTARYRWFAVFYAVMMFFVVPLTVFALSLAGTPLLTAAVSVCLSLASFVVVVNVLQRSRPACLPVALRSWDFLPACLRSLEPADRVVTSVLAFCRRRRRCHDELRDKNDDDDDDDEMNEARLLGQLAENSANRSDERRHAATPPPPDDVCEIVITELDSNSDKVAKEFALTLSKRLTADDVESGYGSALCTPAPSRLASYGQLPQVADLYPPAAPSRLPSYGRLELISEAESTAAATADNDNQNYDATS